MRIVILSVWYSEKMGYIENALPKAMADLGHDVHVVTSTAQVYYNDPAYESTYKPYLGNNILDPGIKKINNYTVHRLPFREIQNKIYIKGLGKVLRNLKPDVVQSFDAFSFLTLQGAFCQPLLRYKYFTGNHIVASVFPLFKEKINILDKTIFFLTRTIPGRISSWVTSRCYPATIDALDIAVKYYGVQKGKVKMVPLGVDTDLFYPSDDRNKYLKKREDLSIDDDQLLCIYTGRFTEGKNPLCLAKAIDQLNKQGEKLKGLFLGDGPQADEISKMKGCIVHDFVPYNELPDFYRVADVGVWPRQESTSMLDAAASGLPIIISDRVKAVERVEGNGLTYIENDVEDLMKKIVTLKDDKLRKKLSVYGVNKIRNQYSWEKIARNRIEDYEKFLK